MNVDKTEVISDKISTYFDPESKEEIINQSKVQLKNSTKNIIKNLSLTKDAWNFIEKPLSESDKKRNQIISDLGEKLSNVNIDNINIGIIHSVGEENYFIIRDKVSKFINLKIIDKVDKIKTKIKEKPIKKIVQMKLDNARGNINKQVLILIDYLKDDVSIKEYESLMISLVYVELRILILMKLLELFTNRPELIENINTEKEEIIIASYKILNNLKKFIKTPEVFKNLLPEYDTNISNQLLIDYEYKIVELAKTMTIKLVDIANRCPKLIFDTKYDITLPGMVLKPYESQLELANLIKCNIDNGFLIFYKTLPGLGKTTMILSLCKFIKRCKITQVKYNKMRVIFCCSDILQSVRVQVLRIMFNFNIKFGIARGISDKQYEIKNSWNVNKDIERELIVADYLSTYLMLKENEASNEFEYILFFDEPTLLTDKKENNQILELLVKILYFLPKHTILSSATLPQMNELNDIIDNYKLKYNNGNVCNVLSNKTLVGCIIKDFASNVISPHSYCNNTTDLEKLLDKIKKYPLLGKFYTLPYLMNLNEHLKSSNLNLDIDNIESFDQESILENILLLLHKICKSPQYINNINNCFVNFINIKLLEIIEENYDKSKIDVDYIKVNYEKLLTSHAFKYIGCCLIATKIPLDFVKNKLYPIVNKIKEISNIKNINNLYEKYKKDEKIMHEKIDAIMIKYTQESIQNEKIQEIEKNKPKFNFPEKLQINTVEHIKACAKYVRSYDVSLLKNSINPETINIMDFNVDEEINFLLYMGVGIYSQNMDKEYLNKVLEMLNDRQLAYIISDESFCYGANYQISNVIIDDSIGDEHSINTILQLIGRTSRIGKSWSGKVYLDNNTCKRMVEFFKSPDVITNEGENITNSYLQFVKDYKCELKIKEEKEIKDKILREEQAIKNEIEKQNNLNKKNKEESEFSKSEIDKIKNFWTGIRNSEPEPESKSLYQSQSQSQSQSQYQSQSQSQYQSEPEKKLYCPSIKNNFDKKDIITDLSDWASLRSINDDITTKKNNLNNELNDEISNKNLYVPRQRIVEEKKYYIPGMLLKNKTTESLIKNKTTEPVIKNKTTEPVIKNNTTEPVIKNNTTEPVIKNNTTESVIKNNTTEPVIKNKTTEPVIKNKKKIDNDSDINNYYINKKK
jgi:hypothetical protein